jgi:nucleoside-diphosphate-sugar epimerase
MAKVALITGANGIVGNALIEWLSKNTTSQEWSKIIATSRKEFKFNINHDDRVQFVSIDFEKGEAEIKKKLLECGAQDVTHVFYTAYVHSPFDKMLVKYNVPMFKEFTRVIDSIAPKLQNFDLQTGSKYFGVHLGPINYPARETDGRHKETEEHPNFYYHQEDFLRTFQHGKKWTWTIHMPSMILGVTKGNGMSMIPSLAVYFLVLKEMGKKALFPGNPNSYKKICNVSYANLIAEFAVWISTNDKTKNDLFTIIDGEKNYTWEELWKGMASYFGVEVEEPTFPTTKADITDKPQWEYKLTDFMKDKQNIWKQVAKKHGCDEKTWDFTTFEFLDSQFGSSWGAYLDMTKAKKLGWNKSVDSVNACFKCFDKMKELKLIPKEITKPLPVKEK